MIIPISVCLIMFIILYLLSRTYRSSFSNINPKEHPLHLLYPLSFLILNKTPLKELYERDKSSLEQLKALYTRDNSNDMKLIHWCRKLSFILIIIILSCIMSLFSIIGSEKSGNLKEGRYIDRPDYSEQEKKVQLDVTIENGNKDIEKSLEIEVEERKYNSEQLQEMFEKTEQYIDKTILGENSSVDEIKFPLKLVHKLPETGIVIEWDLGTDDVIDKNGQLHNETMEEPVLKEIIATLKYGQIQAEYSVFLRILPKEFTEEEEIYENLVNKIKNQQEESQTDSKFTLPQDVDTHTVHFNEQNDSKEINILILGIVLAIVMGIGVDKELQNKLRKRELELLIDYPEIMNKFALLLGAGMTIKNAWGRIANEYCEKLKQKNNSRRYAYEELLITWRELNNGVAEVTAFDNFGKRLKLLPYLKFSSLISQNLKKGSKGLLELLELEAVDAFEERKELAKRLGEEAGTKLLMPMMLMLLIVLFLIMIPAFMTL